ncbi:MAG: cytochrome c, partial [Longimicrobiales bacterium]
ARVYGARCASCHQPEGEGVPGVYPPLVDDPVVVADDPTRHIEIVLYGLQGEAIAGVDYPTAMPGWAEQLSDAEVAAVVNHERTSWGNDAPTVTVGQVAQIRRRGPP